MNRKLNFPTMMLIASILFGLTSQCEMGIEEMNSEEVISEEVNSEQDSLVTGDSLKTEISNCECDFTVDEHLTDGEALNVQPGDVICLKGNFTYDRLLFRNIVGTRSQPVIIRNDGGVASIYSNEHYGMKFENSKNFKLLGNGSTDEYGIKVTTEKGFYVTMEMFTTDFEISRIEVAGANANGLGDRSGFAGIGVKTSPYQDCELFKDPTRQAWIMRNVNIHDNYVHDIGGEGIYMGHGFYNGRTESSCSNITYSHSIQGVRITNNLIENVGYDGIQIKNADSDVEVSLNTIRNYGTKDNNAHNEGLFIGEGTTGKFFKNIIDTGTGNGCQIQGMGNLTIYNNLFINSGGNGIYASSGPHAFRISDGFFHIYNNTIYNSAEYGFIFHNNDGGVKRFANNLIVKAGTLTKQSAEVEMENNLLTNDVASILFLNVAKKNLHLKVGSPGIDAGTDLSGHGVNVGFDGKSRPRGIAYDIGAYEY